MLKKLTLTLLPTLALMAVAFGAEKADPQRAANTVVLDENGVKNLKIETVETEETDFEETIFSLGRIEAIPAKRAVVSSRISGRVIEIKASIGDLVEIGADVVKIESRQPGDPPPSVMLKAPLSGLVSASESRLGEPVEPDKALLEITDLGEVFAVARVPEHLAGKLKAGAVAHIRVSALPDEKFDGTLLRFGTAADKESGTLDAVFRLPNPSLTLRPDMRAEFSIVLGKREGVVTVPRAALQGDALNRFVYVEDFDLKNAFVKTPVVVGAQNDRFVEIVSGLLPGDKVVTRGAYSLAFAGKGSLSLKEALDAAHGHEHAADGGELTDAQKAAKGQGGEEGHEHGKGVGMLTIFSFAGNGLLLVLLIVAMRRKPKADDEPAAPAAKPQPKAEAH
ncbi:MAG: efflux RND transporter periplasmic adaptor subunit [Chthoniobacteraceae bacterium]